MNKKKLGKSIKETRNNNEEKKTYPRPSWLPQSVSDEEELCPECFKVVGEKSRYKLVCLLGRERSGMNVKELTKKLNLKQPTITHHLQILSSVDAVNSKRDGRTRVYTLNRDAHCFEECKIPY